MSYSCECMGVYGELLQLCTVYKNLYFVLQVTQESINTTSHVAIRIRYYKSCGLRLNVEWNQRFI